MKRKPRETQALEAELVRLTALVRQRRKQLERLQECPNQACECRRVWKEQVNQTLASQVRKIRRQVSSRRAKVSRPKASD